MLVGGVTEAELEQFRQDKQEQDEKIKEQVDEIVNKKRLSDNIVNIEEITKNVTDKLHPQKGQRITDADIDALKKQITGTPSMHRADPRGLDITPKERELLKGVTEYGFESILVNHGILELLKVDVKDVKWRSLVDGYQPSTVIYIVLSNHISKIMDKYDKPRLLEVCRGLLTNIKSRNPENKHLISLCSGHVTETDIIVIALFMFGVILYKSGFRDIVAQKLQGTTWFKKVILDKVFKQLDKDLMEPKGDVALDYKGLWEDKTDAKFNKFNNLIKSCTFNLEKEEVDFSDFSYLPAELVPREDPRPSVVKPTQGGGAVQWVQNVQDSLGTASGKRQAGKVSAVSAMVVGAAVAIGTLFGVTVALFTSGFALLFAILYIWVYRGSEHWKSRRTPDQELEDLIMAEELADLRRDRAARAVRARWQGGKK
jgi:hypothetical protein